jgi:hypothetical protein
MFDVGRSMFISFFFDQTGRFGKAASAWSLRHGRFGTAASNSQRRG